MGSLRIFEKRKFGMKSWNLVDGSCEGMASFDVLVNEQLDFTSVAVKVFELTIELISESGVVFEFVAVTSLFYCFLI